MCTTNTEPISDLNDFFAVIRNHITIMLPVAASLFSNIPSLANAISILPANQFRVDIVVNIFNLIKSTMDLS